MKLKKLLAFGLALVMCLAMAACGTNPDENPEESTSQTDAEPVSITVTENWDFSVGFYPVITPMVSSTYGAGFWSRNFYNTLVSYDDNGTVSYTHLDVYKRQIQSYSEKALIQNIAFVFQHSQLLKTSIYENVRIGNSQATRQQIMDALDAANCTSILDKFSQREMTVIGAKGVYLSGGEVQRIAIARAILKNANIIIMDEASAAADPENEYELQQAFQKLMRGKTVIMIAHRLSSIQNLSLIHI